MINGLDIPKLYFHELIPSLMRADDGIYDYAIVDGKQRLEAFWGFMDGKFPLDDDAKYFADDSIKIGARAVDLA